MNIFGIILIIILAWFLMSIVRFILTPLGRVARDVIGIAVAILVLAAVWRFLPHLIII